MTDNLPAVREHAGGKPPHVPTDATRAQVAALFSCGIRQDDIATYLEIDKKTLLKYYRRELDIAKTKRNMRMARRLFNAGIKEGNVTAMIFWMKAQAGWSDNPVVGADDADDITPTEITVERKDARLAE